MTVLDENIVEGQRRLLAAWGIPVRQVGYDLARKGLKDEEIVVTLHDLRRLTFITRDAGFYRRDLCHLNYCVVVVSANQYEVAAFVRRFLRHKSFDTQRKRMGKVVKVMPSGVTFWMLRKASEASEAWHDRL